MLDTINNYATFQCLRAFQRLEIDSARTYICIVKQKHTTQTMEQAINILKVDITKLKTVHNYAKDKNLTPAAIYKQAKNDKVKIIIIDGMKFVHI